MKVMFFTPAFEEGGGERLYVNLLRNLPRDEIDATLVCWKMHESHFVDELPDDVPLYDLRREGRFRTELPRLVCDTRRLIDDLRPDAIMAISTEINWGLWLARRLAQYRPPIVLNEQGSPAGWLALLRRTSPMRARVVVEGYRRVYLPQAACVIAVSDAVRGELIEGLGAPPERVVTIPNPLDIDAVRRAGAEAVQHPFLDGSAPLVVSTGRFFFQKGYDVLVRAFAVVAGATDARLILVGDGPERARLETLIDDLGIRERCALVGYHDNPFPFVAAGTVFALPSRTEGFGYVLVEAMALGVPVVTADAAGPAEIVDRGRYGVVVPVDAPDALAAALLDLLRNAGVRQRLRMAGRSRVADFGVDRVVRTYVDMFHRVAAA